MRYRKPLYRPPSEADSYILQITYGCSHNKCTFCGMYRNKQFKIRPVDEVTEDIKKASEYYPDTRRVFLADGDAFVLNTDKLEYILKKLNCAFPLLQRVGIYANPSGILEKTDEELKILKKLKLTIAYLGLESGDEKLLEKINKGFTAGEMIDATLKAQRHGIKMSVIILLGLGGIKGSRDHSIKTAETLNNMNPRYLSALTLMPVKETHLFNEIKTGNFTILSPEDILKELRMIIERLELDKTIFRSNHASNYLHLRGRFPKDKGRLLSELEYVIENFGSPDLVTPEFLRGL